MQQLKVAKEAATAAVHVRANCSFKGFEYTTKALMTELALLATVQTVPQLNLDAASFQPRKVVPEMTMSQESVSLAISSSLSINRVPVPGPTKFSGDLLIFTHWKMFFMTHWHELPTSN